MCEAIWQKSLTASMIDSIHEEAVIGLFEKSIRPSDGLLRLWILVNSVDCSHDGLLSSNHSPGCPISPWRIREATLRSGDVGLDPPEITLRGGNFEYNADRCLTGLELARLQCIGRLFARASKLLSTSGS